MSWKNKQQLLNRLKFEREIAPINSKSDLMIYLLNNHAFNYNSAVKIHDSFKINDWNDLINNDVIKLISKKPVIGYLTSFGKLIATGEYVMRENEKIIGKHQLIDEDLKANKCI